MLLRNPFTRDARVLREARSLAAAGHDVTVVAIRTQGSPEEETRDGFRILRSVEAKSWMGPTILGAGEEQPVVPGARGIPGGRLGTFARRMARPPAAVIARDVALERAMRKAAEDVPSDAIHAHDLNTLPAAISIGKDRGIPVIYDAHELYPDLTGLSPVEKRRWRGLEERYIGQAAAVIAPTAARADVLRDRYGIEPPLVVMNCPDPPSEGVLDARLEGLRREGEPLAVYAGGFTPNRGLDNLIVAVGSTDRLRLALLGWGPLEAELRAVAEPFGDAIVFAGSVEPDLVIPVCRHADIGIVAYEAIGLNNELAAPNKLFEYMHAGLAVAGSALPDMRRIITEHEIGATFNASDPASIEDALIGLADADLEGMKQRSKAAASGFTWDSQAQVLLALYERLSG